MQVIKVDTIDVAVDRVWLNLGKPLQAAERMPSILMAGMVLGQLPSCKP